MLHEHRTGLFMLLTRNEKKYDIIRSDFCYIILEKNDRTQQSLLLFIRGSKLRCEDKESGIIEITPILSEERSLTEES